MGHKSVTTQFIKKEVVTIILGSPCQRKVNRSRSHVEVSGWSPRPFRGPPTLAPESPEVDHEKEEKKEETVTGVPVVSCNPLILQPPLWVPD